MKSLWLRTVLFFSISAFFITLVDLACCIFKEGIALSKYVVLVNWPPVLLVILSGSTVATLFFFLPRFYDLKKAT